MQTVNRNEAKTGKREVWNLQRFLAATHKAAIEYASTALIGKLAA